MQFGRFRFGSMQVDGTTYKDDLIIDRGRIRKRKKKPSKPFPGTFGHTHHCPTRKRFLGRVDGW